MILLSYLVYYVSSYTCFYKLYIISCSPALERQLYICLCVSVVHHPQFVRVATNSNSYVVRLLHLVKGFFTHAPCGSMGQQMDIFSSSFSFSFFQPPTFCFSQVQKTTRGGVGVSLRYRKRQGGVWVFLSGTENDKGGCGCFSQVQKTTWGVWVFGCVCHLVWKGYLVTVSLKTVLISCLLCAWLFAFLLIKLLSN